MYRDKKAREKLPLEHRLAVGSSFLAFNQGLIQFADAKANGLLLANSIFIASMVPVLEGKHAHGPMAIFAAVSLGLCVLALLWSLGVTLARAPATDDPRPRSLHFHKHVSGFSRAQTYVDEFREADGEQVLDAILTSNYDLAGIASKKFRAYKTAEHLTLVAAILWVINLGAALLG